MILIDGTFFTEDMATISVRDRGFLFGDGVFTTVKVSEGKAWHVDEHSTSLKRQCRVLDIIPPFIHPEWVEDLIVKNGAQRGLWKLKIIITAHHVVMLMDPYEGAKEVYRLKSAQSTLRGPLAQIKSLASLPRLYQKAQCDADDVLVTTPEGFVLETAVCNVFWKERGELYTPDPTLPLYYGTTMRSIKNVHPVQVKLEDIGDDAQFYVCNALIGVKPVVQVDDRMFARDLAFERFLAQFLYDDGK